MYVKREIEDAVLNAAKSYPVVLITGPRQSGKTTLVKNLFSGYRYYNLEFPDVLSYARSDPRDFLSSAEKIVIDEAQNYPEIFSYIQGFADERGENGIFILTGSSNLKLREHTGQSLAGRVAIFELLPLSVRELSASGRLENDYHEQILKGFYPKVIADNVNPTEWYANYVSTYLQRDVLQIINIKDLAVFTDFLRLAAANAGQIINYNKFASELGVDGKTIKSWFSVLEATYIVFRVRPFYKNYGKRITKKAKFYFYDVGLAAYLLNLRSADQIRFNPLRGALFENMVMAEIRKQLTNKRLADQMYFWRDAAGNEVDCLLEIDGKLTAIEIKSAKTFNSSFLTGLNRFAGSPDEKIIIYGGDMTMNIKGTAVVPWFDFVLE